MRFLRGLVLILGLMGILLYSELSSRDASLPISHEPLIQLQIRKSIPLPEAILKGPRPEKINSETPEVAFFFLSFMNAATVNFNDENISLETTGDAVCDQKTIEIGEFTYAIELSNCRGSGTVALIVDSGIARNANDETGVGGPTSHSLKVVGKPKPVKIKVPKPAPSPEPTPEPIAAPSPEPVPEVTYVPRPDIQAHEVTITRPRSGTIYVRTDLTSYYYQTDDPSTRITFKRPLNGNRFVAVKHFAEPGGKNILFWKRSDLPSKQFETDENGEFKIDLIDLQSPKDIILEPIYSN